jgi:hypothetical protein
VGWQLSVMWRFACLFSCEVSAVTIAIQRPGKRNPAGYREHALAPRCRWFGAASIGCTLANRLGNRLDSPMSASYDELR